MRPLTATFHHASDLAGTIGAHGIICTEDRGEVVVIRVATEAELDVVARVSRRQPNAPILVLVPRSLACDNALRALRAIEYGAYALLPADADPARVAAAIVEIAERGSLADPFASELLIKGLHSRALVREQYAITARERDVLRLLVEGRTAGEIASALGICLTTAQTHLKNLYRKLDVDSKTAATALAVRHHLL